MQSLGEVTAIRELLLASGIWTHTGDRAMSATGF
jgi:hypothetical protein